jgi:hypothetical protein
MIGRPPTWRDNVTGGRVGVDMRSEARTETPLMTPDNVNPDERNAFYRDAMTVLTGSGVRFMVGGAYALERYTGIGRKTKDIDLFVLPRDVRRVLFTLSSAGYRTQMTEPVWLATAFHDGHFIDIVFNSGNGICLVDESWFDHAPDAEVLGVRVKLGPVEETIWQKAFIMERERFDGADVNHLLLHCGPTLDWERLLARFGDHWPVLLSHLLLFQYSYPGMANAVPRWVMRMLLARVGPPDALPDATDRLCRGTLLSRAQYAPDVENGLFDDARLIESRRVAA